MAHRIQVLDMHTGGEPLRIVREGYPDIPGATILEKRRYVREHLDHFRRFLMFEPRGHKDMYGAILVQPSLPDADLAVLFMHNEGYSTMCGHAVIALGRYAIDHGLVEKTEPVTRVNIECPCGLVRADVAIVDGRAGPVSFESVPAFLHTEALTLPVPGLGSVTCDIAYGGAFYVLIDTAQLGLTFGEDPARAFVDAADAVSAAVKASQTLDHPDHDDLAFLYGTIITDGKDAESVEPTRNVCVFADRQVDRSPTGSGVTARLAAQVAKGQLPLDTPRTFESITGAKFVGRAKAGPQCGTYQTILATISGSAHYYGESTFWLDEGDELGMGFLLD